MGKWRISAAHMAAASCLIVVIATTTGMAAAMISTPAMLVQHETERPKANDGHDPRLLTLNIDKLRDLKSIDETIWALYDIVFKNKLPPFVNQTKVRCTAPFTGAGGGRGGAGVIICPLRPTVWRLVVSGVPALHVMRHGVT